MPENGITVRASKESRNRMLRAAVDLRRLRQTGTATIGDTARACQDLFYAARVWHESGRQRGTAAGQPKARPMFSTPPRLRDEPHRSQRRYIGALSWYASKYAWDVRDGNGEA